MKFILGTKQQMTQVFDEQGRVRPATILKTEPMKVTQVKTEDKDGYSAVQVGSGAQKEHRLNKAQRKLGVRDIKEFAFDGDAPAVGSVIDVGAFAPGDQVVVSALSKGKGFQGVVKRHGFHGGPRSHGQKHSEREPGSIGSTGPQRVFKGMRMAGRMGGTRVTVENLEVLEVDKKNNVLIISGAIPGRRGTLVEVRSK